MKTDKEKIIELEATLENLRGINKCQKDHLTIKNNEIEMLTETCKRRTDAIMHLARDNEELEKLVNAQCAKLMEIRNRAVRCIGAVRCLGADLQSGKGDK